MGLSFAGLELIPDRRVNCRMTVLSRVLSFALFAALLSSCGGSGGGDDPPVVIRGTGVERVDTAMNDIMDRYAPPGISVAVVRDGRLVIANAYGTADLAGTQTLRPDHLFRVASVSKPVTGIATLKAIEDGLLDPDAAVFDILASYLPATGADPRLPLMTVRDLLHHTGGWDFFDHPDDPLFRSKEIADALGTALPLDPATLVRWVAQQPLAFDPGTDFAYTNIGYVALGRIIESSTGFVYEDFVRQFVLGPAGITRARLGGMTRAERLADEVEYESFQNAIWKSVFDGVTVVPEPAYGGINLVGFDASSAWLFSAVDLVRLAAATDGDDAYPDILSRQSIEVMTAVGTPVGSPPLGVAWFLETDAVGNVVGWDHSGGMPGTTSYLARMPGGVIVAVVSNTAREQDFFRDLVIGLRNAVQGITDWPQTDLFPQYQ
jgi:CubicO group peptidase (beta-lactamase class C family)